MMSFTYCVYIHIDKLNNKKICIGRLSRTFLKNGSKKLLGFDTAEWPNAAKAK